MGFGNKVFSSGLGQMTKMSTMPMVKSLRKFWIENLHFKLEVSLLYLFTRPSFCVTSFVTERPKTMKQFATLGTGPTRSVQVMTIG